MKKGMNSAHIFFSYLWGYLRDQVKSYCENKLKSLEYRSWFTLHSLVPKCFLSIKSMVDSLWQAHPGVRHLKIRSSFGITTWIFFFTIEAIVNHSMSQILSKRRKCEIFLSLIMALQYHNNPKKMHSLKIKM